MFQQFKNISLNIRSLTNAVGLNEEEWRNRGLERFEALKSEFQNLNALLSNRSEAFSQNQVDTRNYPSVLELEATSHLINALEEKWQAVQERNQDNIRKADNAEQLLRVLVDFCQQHVATCEQLNNSKKTMDSIQQNLATMTEIADDLKNKLSALASDIRTASVNHERQQFEEWKQQLEVEHAQKMEEKYKTLRVEEARLKEAYEEHNRLQTQKRLELYDATFQAELEDYRRRREFETSSLYSNIPRSSENPELSLASLKLENAEHQDLDDFFNEATPQAQAQYEI
ncbi:uncharacterized protein BYT42DRAFT_612893 [Radiomyces spectabilis]|uniref:uncharacterized protein n=1 Tax=Radiomyces spectabilis TaxID=64574 RepID=UPI00222040D5|nr:uncharacterized protein BYT42DRAFT_612893 [Radiomyces spectabilis]KAI8381075.1 hypothetical protein BYT42DRAFT_612893 [Radiomyces spectabilis]